jgi:hypothetical protein
LCLICAPFTKHHRECYWGSDLSSSIATESDCNMPCGGDSTSLCGGGNRMNIYEDSAYQLSPVPSSTATTTKAPSSVPSLPISTEGPGTTAPVSFPPIPVSTGNAGNTASASPSSTPIPVVNAGIGNYTSRGCYYDDVDDRAVPDGQAVDRAMTVEKCISIAAADGWVSFLIYELRMKYILTLESDMLVLSLVTNVGMVTFSTPPMQATVATWPAVEIQRSYVEEVPVSISMRIPNGLLSTPHKLTSLRSSKTRSKWQFRSLRLYKTG